ncbi:unnamed protein product [Lathyrus sativus]|nr:unnamed protein product [Lathyrus sativus]
MACSTLQSGSSTRKTWKYDVFVSFRGEDTRNNFTDHLFGALHKKSIITFRDDAKLKRGEDISSELLQAIEGSQILIVVFSTNYAASTWCLQELAKIADCIQVSGQTVLPIFYDVTPSEVRKQSGVFEKSFQEHEERFKAKLEEVQRWRRALTQIANLSGWDVKDKSQYTEIGKIIKEVTCLLGNKYSNLRSDIVGVHSRVEELENLLTMDSDDDDVRVLGICGMGGIGKTTLATALYAKISNQFDACCFIDDVSKVYGDHGPIGVQKQLLCQTLNEENLQICNLPMASNLIRTRLSRIKSLVFLDNVDEVEQLDKLDMKKELLGTGSRIIIISRNEHILREHGVDEVYRVRLLDRKCALQLFCRKAFKSDDIMSGYIYLTYDVLKYARGLPLAIKVLGSFLYGRDVTEWRSALSRLRANPRTDIMNVLRISFDGLEDTEKDIFLDIACFLHGHDEVYVKEVLDFRGFHPEIGLRVLVDKSFITCENLIIRMHYLFKELGKSIVREISPREPRKWNRLWDYKDVHNVISKNMATENLEAIVMQCDPENDKEIQKITLRAEALAKMSHLKLLKLLQFNFSGSLNFLSSELGYLFWDKYPFTSLPSSFQPHKLVQLVLPHSNIRKLWEGTKCLPNLKYINLSKSKNLIMMPSFKEIPNLESLCLEGCVKLVKIDPSIGTLRRLSRLSLKNCINLVSIPDNIFGLSSLQDLNLSGCPNLFNSKMLEIQRQTEQLEMLDNKESTTQYQLTLFISKFLEPHFRYLIFRKPEDSGCLLLPSLSRLSCLQYLDLSYCNLLQIPNAIGLLHCLETLYLGGNNFVTLPPSIKELSKLRQLNLEHCKQLKYLPELPSKYVLPVRRTTYFNAAEFNIFDCPSLMEMECCYGMAFSWMIQLLQVHMQSEIPLQEIRIVIPKTQIPKWFNKQNVCNSISMDPSPIMHDKNLIGVACCLTFVAHDNPTNLGDKEPHVGFGFHSKQHGRGIYSSFLNYLRKDLVTVDLEHFLLLFLSRERFIHWISRITDELDDISGIELRAMVVQPVGLHVEVKNCGYRWISKEDLEQLNPQMMYSGNLSVQPYH